MRYHLFQNFLGKIIKIKKTSFHSTREDTNFLPPLYNMIDKDLMVFENDNHMCTKIIKAVIKVNEKMNI